MPPRLLRRDRLLPLRDSLRAVYDRGVARGRHCAQDIVPGIGLHHDFVGEHAAVPADVFDAPRRGVPQPVFGGSGDIEFSVGVVGLAMSPGLVVRAGAVDGAVVLGDVNADGVADNLDITPFIAALAAEDEAAFLLAFPEGNFAAADIDMSGGPDNLDITPFIGLLTAASATVVPEPNSLAMLALSALLMLRRCARAKK